MALERQGCAPMAVLQDTPALDDLQKRMHLALVATPIELSGVPPTAKELFAALQTLCGGVNLASYITTYEHDYILHFDSVQSRDAVKHLGFLATTTATLSLSFWTPYYRNHTVSWDLKVVITVSRIPPNSCHPDILPPLLSAYCDIRSSSFDKSNGTCEIVAFTSTPSAIPTSGTIAYRERTAVSTILRTYPVSLMARVAEIPCDEIADHPFFKAFCAEYPQYHFTMLHTAFQFGVDPDVLFRYYLDTTEVEDIANGLLVDPDDIASPDSMMDYDEYSCKMDRLGEIPSDEIADHPLFKAFCEEYPHYHVTMLQTAFVFDVDPDVLFDHYVEASRDEDIANGLVFSGDDTSSSDCSMDYDGYSSRMMDQYSPSDDLSDREPAEWRGRNI